MSDFWRLDEFAALPDTCALDGCANDEAEQRGPVRLKDGTIHKFCPEHWEAVIGILGRQATWDNPDDAMRVEYGEHVP